MNSSKVKYHIAESPAFILEQYRSVQYSTWAESTLVVVPHIMYILIIAHRRWSTILLRMYLVTSIEQQVSVQHTNDMIF